MRARRGLPPSATAPIPSRCPRSSPTPSPTPIVNEALASERKLFDLRRTARRGQKDQLHQRIQQLREQISGLTAQQDAKTKEMALIEQELAGVRELWAKNLVQLNRLTSLQREEARLEGERGQLIAAAAEAKGKTAETELQILQLDQDLSSDVAKELRETDSKIGEYVERKVTAEDQLKRTDIRAPQDGVVFQSTANTVGGVITAGDPIMLIVPEADTLLVEAKVEPKDIDQVQYRSTGRAPLLRVQYAHDARAQRHRRAHRRRYHHRPAHRTELLSRPHRHDRRRAQPPRRRQADAGHAGRGLHPDRRAHDALVPGQAAARSAHALVSGEVISRLSLAALTRPEWPLWRAVGLCAATKRDRLIMKRLVRWARQFGLGEAPVIKGEHVASCNVWSRQRRSNSLSFAVLESTDWPFSTFAAAHQSGSDRGKSGRAADIAELTQMTRLRHQSANLTSRPPMPSSEIILRDYLPKLSVGA